MFTVKAMFRSRTLQFLGLGLLLAICLAQLLTAQTNWVLSYQENFEDGVAEKWNLGSCWSIENDHGNNVLNGEGTCWAQYGGNSWKNYSFEVKVKLIQGVANLYFRDNPEQRYIINVSTNRIDLAKEVDELPPHSLQNTDIFFNYQSWHTIKIQGIDDKIKIYADSVLKIEYTDPDPIAYGTIGLEIFGHGHFDDLIVMTESPLPPGTSWQKTGGPIGGLGYDIRIHPLDKNIMFVTDNPSGVNKSYDGGATWVQKNYGLEKGGGSASGPSGDGFPIFSLTIDPNNPQVVWAGTQEFKGIYKSVDEGETWEKKVSGIIEGDEISFRGFAVRPGNSNVVLAAGEIVTEKRGIEFSKTKGKIYKSTDGGESWYPVWEGNNLARVLIYNPLHPDTVYCSTGIFDREAYNGDENNGFPGGEGILKSIDGGESWFHINNGIDNLFVGFLTMHPTNPEILFAASGNNAWSSPPYNKLGGIYRTTNGGETWEKVLSGDLFTVVTLSPSNPDIIYAGSAQAFYRSNDGGNTWRKYFKQEEGCWGPPGIRPGIPISAVVDPEDPLTIFANNYIGGVFKSIDGAVTWINSSAGYTGANLWDIAIDTHTPRIVYTITRGGPFRSLNGGEDWTGLAFPPANKSEWYSIAINPDNNQEIIACDQHQGVIHKSTDGGNSWREVFRHPLVRGSDPHNRHGFKAIAYAPSSSNIIYAGMRREPRAVENDLGMPCGPSFGVYKSIDGGETWKEINSGLESSDKNINDIAVHPLDPDIVFIGTLHDGIFKTIDGGGHWIPKNTGLVSMNVRSLAIDPVLPEIIYAGLGEGAGIAKSTNGGQLWEEVNNGVHVECPSYLGRMGRVKQGISLEKPKSFFNTDYYSVPWSIVKSIVIDPTNSQTIYAADWHTGVYMSTDGGASWTMINQGLSTRAIPALAISADGKILYAATSGEGVFRLVLGGNQKPQIISFYPANDDTVIILEKQNKEFRINAFDLNGDPLFYSWEFNGVEIAGAISSTYTLETANLEEEVYLLKAIVTDETDSVEVKWIINYVVNDAPVVSSIPDLIFNEDDSVSIDLDQYITDEENDTTQINWSYKLGSEEGYLLVTINPNNHILTLKTSSDWYGGPVEMVLTATDQGGKSDSDTVNVTVLPVNDAPQFTSIPDPVAIEDSLYVYDVNAIDVDGDPVKYALIIFPEGMTINDTSGVIQWLPTNEDVGDTTVTVQGADGKGGVADQSFTLTVRNTNDAPTITSTSPTTAVEDSLFVYQVTASDPDGDALFYSLLVSPEGMTIIDTTGLVQWLPTNDDVGDTTVTIEVSDHNGGMDQQSFNMTVINVNDQPLSFNLLSPGDGDTVKISEIQFLWEKAVDVDPGDTVRYHLQYSTNRDFSEMVAVGDLADTTYALEDSLESSTTYFWRVLAYDLKKATTTCNHVFRFTTETISGIKKEWGEFPQNYFLSQNYPNPFNPETTIEYQLPEPAKVILKVYSLLGQEIRVLVNEQKEAGYYSITWDGKNNKGERVTSGIYIFRMESSSERQNYVETKKMILLQ